MGRLAATDRSSFLAHAVRRSVRSHTFLFFEGDPSHNVIVLEAGYVKIASTIDDREITLDVLGPGEIIGELGAVDGAARSATASTLTDVRALFVSAASFSGLVGTSPGVAASLAHDMARRLRDASQRQVEYGALDGLGTGLWAPRRADAPIRTPLGWRRRDRRAAEPVGHRVVGGALP